MAWQIACLEAVPSTCASPVARLTLTLVTPSTCCMACSTVVRQWLQFMPSTAKISTCSVCKQECFLLFLILLIINALISNSASKIVESHEHHEAG